MKKKSILISGTLIVWLFAANLAYGRHSETLDIKFGYSQMLATETMEVFRGGKGSGIQNWA